MDITSIDMLQQYLLETRQTDPLAQRQAHMICRCIEDEQRRNDALAIVLLTLAGLRNGSPRLDKAHLLKPVMPEVIASYAAYFRTTTNSEASWGDRGTDMLTVIEPVVAALLRDPCLFAPVSGREPTEHHTPWPLLVAGKMFIGFSRYWASIRKLEEIHMPGRLIPSPHTPDDATVKTVLREVFTENNVLTKGNRFHCRQIAAAALACRTRFCIISGGPGTGKTSVVLQILRTILRIYPAISPDRVVLCAPTGRAKARLGDSLDKGIDLLSRHQPVNGCSTITPDNLLKSVQRKTIHSLLGQRPDGTFRFNRENPLPCQIIIIDEASMVDITLFTAVVEALPDECRLLLVGDMHQLPSIEAGALLGDLTECFSTVPGYASLSVSTGTWMQEVTAGIPADDDDCYAHMVLNPSDSGKTGSLTDHAIILTHSYRSSKAILDCAHAINRGDIETVLTLTTSASSGHTAVSIDTAAGMYPIATWCKNHFSTESIHRAYQTLGDDRYETDTGSRFALSMHTILFESVILTLAHEGVRGRRAINVLAGKMLREILDNPPGDVFFHGMPVILGSNHHDLDLYNGDLGIVIHTREGITAGFPRGETCRMVALDRLSNIEPAFALTVHKAQGSEFDAVLLVLPENNNPLLTRQILYTGITRAKHRVRILGTKDIMKKGIENREQRTGGIQL